MNSAYLRIIDLSSLAESLDTFCPLYLIMKSPFCNPADAAGEPVKYGVRDSHLRRMAMRILHVLLLLEQLKTFAGTVLP